MKSPSMGWSSARSSRLVMMAISAIVIYSVILAWTGGADWTPGTVTWADAKDAPHGPANGPRRNESSDFDRASNRTLGFEKVIAIGLPERSDKRDAMDLMASLSGFDLHWVDGVKSSAIPDKAVPFGIDVSKLQDNFLGSWRGHMDAIRHVVASGVSSALILEDDMDWDIHLKSQLIHVARGARHIYGESSPLPNSPYGDAWDILWLGHCGEPFPETLEENTGLPENVKTKMSPKYVINGDGTVPPYSQVSHLVDWSAYPPHTRLVHISAAPICSFAYAISQSAARKILYALSVDGLYMAFDNSLAQLCRDAVYDLGRERDDGYGFKCLSVNPTLMFHHRAKGRVAGDSDIQSYGTDGAVREKGTTEAIRWSMRLNLKNILTGQPPKPQFEGQE